MKLQLPIQIDREQWMRRMGVDGDPTIELLTQMREAEKKLMENAKPCGIYRIMPVDAITPAGDAIKKHLEKCHEVIIMGVTLGAMVDFIVRTAQIRNMAEAFVLESGASVMIEQVANQLEGIIKRAHFVEKPEEYITSRYSPGYGDYPLELQTELIWLMDAHRRIGLTVNEHYMMTPQKSITAVMGISEIFVTGHLSGCDGCRIKESCVSRKEGKHCAGLKE